MTRPPAILVLAGRRSSTLDPLAAKMGVSHKALVPVAGEAMVGRVLRIAAEDPKAILSDDQLVEMLRAKGFDIARRTVAKYREAIGIGSSVQRRRQKALGTHAA